MKCQICHKDPDPTCNYNQGRCPYRKPLINIQPSNTVNGHFYISLVKSSLRICAGVTLMIGNLWITGLLLVLAEILGITEEMV